MPALVLAALLPFLLAASPPATATASPCTRFSGWYRSSTGEELLVFDRNGRYLDLFARRGPSAPLQEWSVDPLQDREHLAPTALVARDAAGASVQLAFGGACERVTVQRGQAPAVEYARLDPRPRAAGGSSPPSIAGVVGPSLSSRSGPSGSRLAISGWYRDPRTREELLVFDCGVEPPARCVPAVIYRRSATGPLQPLSVTRFDLARDQPFLEVAFGGKPGERYLLAFPDGVPISSGTMSFTEANPLLCGNPDGSLQRFARLGRSGVVSGVDARAHDDPCLPVTSRFPRDLPRTLKVGLDVDGEVVGGDRRHPGGRYRCEVTLRGGGKAEAGEGCALSWIMGEAGVSTGAWRWSRSDDALIISTALIAEGPGGCAEVYCRQECGPDDAACLERCTDCGQGGGGFREDYGAMTFTVRPARFREGRVLVSVTGVPANGSNRAAEHDPLERCECAVEELCIEPAR